MERARRRIAAVIGFCLLFALISFAAAATVYNIAGDQSLIAVEMRRHTSPKVTGLPDQQYPEMGHMIADYLMGRRNDFQYYFTDSDGNMVVCFSAHEENHMADCRRLIGIAGSCRWILAGVSLVLIIAAFALRQYGKSFANGMLAGFCTAVLICLVCLAWGLMSFDNLFTAFHRLLFTNEGWILDSRTDMLIRLMPASFFVSMGIKVLLAVVAVALVCFTAAMTIRMLGNSEVKEEPQEEAAVQGV
ncbi:MAG: TIGR01906 family membrane protein [Clostridia bacterium]|nr:TIGR01906 family membrane protein [Clostridia bacterium]MBR6965763.1 TIGR01906 family membrane protein [Clostridia bacterium]